MRQWQSLPTFVCSTSTQHAITSQRSKLLAARNCSKTNCHRVINSRFAFAKWIAMPLSVLFGPDALEYRLQDSAAVIALIDEASLENLSGIGSNAWSIKAREAIDTPVTPRPE